VLKPQPVGKGRPEVSVILIYDIEDDRLRTRASDICQDYGLERIQFSAFFGKLNRNRRQELALKLKNEMGDEAARIRMIPICEEDLKDMWVMDQYRRVVEVKKVEGETVGAVAAAGPRLRILRQEEED
jgi:CRISPR-associated protein Cas2